MDINNSNYQTAQQTKTSQQVQYQGNAGMKCPHCGETVDPHLELCPFCGYPLHADHCTFCGAPMIPGEKFCTECGNAVSGIVCPKCGTLNFRSFCINCREPLDDLAAEAIAQAEKDPVYQEVRRLAEEVEEAAKKVEEELKTVTKQKGKHLEQLSSEEEPLSKKEESPAEKEFSLKLAKLNHAMQQILPPPNMTPQMQRTFYRAREVKQYTKMKVTKLVRNGWVCNYCGCHHNCPQECVSPELGGRWLTERVEEEQIVETWTKQ